METKRSIFTIIAILTLVSLTGCINIEKSKADLIIEECIKTGCTMINLFA